MNRSALTIGFSFSCFLAVAAALGGCNPGAASAHGTVQPGAACASAASCGPGQFCVEGVCCTSACNEPCNHCAAPGSATPGTCSAVSAPTAVDRPASLPSSNGKTWRVSDGPALQIALAGARAGDTILLSTSGPSLDYGQIQLPAQPPGQDWIVIRADTVGSTACPADHGGGVVDRFDPLAFPDCKMPRFTTSGVGNDGLSAISTAEGAHHYWLAGLEVARSPEAGILMHGLVAVGNGSAATVHHIVLDRLFIHGANDGSDAALQSHAGIEPRGGHIAVLNSRITGIQTQITPGSPCSGACTEAQGISIPNGGGPYEIRNNYIAASTENVFVGGADTWNGNQDPVNNDMPKDLTIVGNHLYKPPSWFVIPYQTGGNNRLVKNLFELKAAERVRFEGNYLENAWSSVDEDPAQAYPPGPSVSPGYGLGNAITLTPRNQKNATPHAHIRDVNIVNNRIVQAQRGMSALGDDDHYPSGTLSCTNISNNLFDKIPGDQPWSANIPQTNVDGWLITHISGRSSGTINLTFEHNTAFNAGPALYEAHNGPAIASVGFVFRNNLVHALGGGVLGIEGASLAEGLPVFDDYLGGMSPPAGAVFTHNDLVGASAAQQALYGACSTSDASCLFSQNDDGVGFAAQAEGRYQVVQASGAPPAGSPDYLRCSHGTHDIGAYDWDALSAARRDAHPEP